MKEAIERRELIVLDGLDVVIRGTYHRTYYDGFGVPPNLIKRDRIGVLFLNSLSPTRASHGDSAVYWADSFAERGYPSFRLDLPGFGDSEGDPPTELLGFTDQGGYTSIASVKIRELVTRFNLSGVVLVGQCEGGVSALYTTAACRECKGLVLMDPYFHQPQVIRPAIRLSCRGNMPPDTASLPLLRRWNEVASTGLPILILKWPSGKADGLEPEVGEFDYSKYVLGLEGRKSQVVVKVLGGVDHSLVSRLGRAAVCRYIKQWLNAHFPLIRH